MTDVIDMRSWHGLVATSDWPANLGPPPVPLVHRAAAWPCDDGPLP